MKTRLLLIALSSLNFASFADAQTATIVAASPLPPTADYSASGSFKTVSEDKTGPKGTYTIVRPETLGKDGFLHAPIIFGPGIGGSVESMMNLPTSVGTRPSPPWFRSMAMVRGPISMGLSC